MRTQEPGNEHVQEATRLLRTKGLRSTRARRSIISELLRIGKPMSHGEMLVAVASEMLDRATVYRVLIDLEQAGVLSRTDLGDRLWRFEVARRLDHDLLHPHFVCLSCQTVTCLEGASFSFDAKATSPASVASGTFSIRLSGLCDSCRSSAKPARVARGSTRAHRPHGGVRRRVAGRLAEC